MQAGAANSPLPSTLQPAGALQGVTSISRWVRAAIVVRGEQVQYSARLQDSRVSLVHIAELKGKVYVRQHLPQFVRQYSNFESLFVTDCSVQGQADAEVSCQAFTKGSLYHAIAQTIITRTGLQCFSGKHDGQRQDLPINFEDVIG